MTGLVARVTGDRFRSRLALIALGALAFRLWYVLFQRPTVSVRGADPNREFFLWGDAFFYHWQARGIADGLGYVEPIGWQLAGVVKPGAGHPPAHSTYLAVWSWLGVDSITGHRIASVLAGVAGVVLIALLARRLAGDFAGLVAGGIAAVYPMLWINDAMMMSESLAVPLTALALLAAYRFHDAADAGPGRRLLVAAGLLGAAVALAALTRSELALLLPLVGVPLAVLARALSWRDRITAVLVMGGAALLVVAPWVGYNLSRFEEPTFISNGAGIVLSAASCDLTYDTTSESFAYYANCFDARTDVADESVRDRIAREHALEYVRDHLGELPVVVTGRVARLWGVWVPWDTTYKDWSVEGRGRAESVVGMAMFYGLAALTIVGLVMLRRRGVPVLPLLAVIAVVTVAAATTFGVTRYRVPAEVVLVAVAAVAIDGWRRRWRRRSGGTGDAQPEPVGAAA